MSLTKEQLELYTAVGAGKEVRWQHLKGLAETGVYKGALTDPPLGHVDYDWRVVGTDTIKLNYTIPKPLTEEPEDDSEYWYFRNEGYIYSEYWSGLSGEKDALKAGLLFESADDASAAYDARVAAFEKALNS